MDSDKQDLFDKNNFAMAALILGGISIVCIRTIFIPLFAGSFALLFGLLSKRSNQRLLPTAKLGIGCSAFGLIYGTVALVISLVTLPQNLQDPEFMKNANTVYEQLYGVSLEDYMDQTLGEDFLDDLSKGGSH